MMIVDEENAYWGRESRLKKKNWDEKFVKNWTINGFEKGKDQTIRDFKKKRTWFRWCYLGRILNSWVGKFINFYKDNGHFSTFLFLNKMQIN